MADQGTSIDPKGAQATGARGDEAQLHFYPGDKRLIFFLGLKVVLDVEAWGGPDEVQPKRAGERFPPAPTTPGRFRIGWIGQYLTPTWKLSQLAWGTPIKRDPKSDSDFLYQVGPGRWRSVKQKTGVGADELVEEYERLTLKRGVPDKWVFNDFGPIAVRYYRDKNNNRKQDKDEPLSGEMFHTTPDNEVNPRAPLGLSHGCVHVRPSDRDRLIQNGAFKIGTLLVIHRYGEACLVPRRPAGPA
jgi:hypothetical protein